MVKQSKALFMLSLLVTATYAAANSMVLSHEELSAVARNPEVSYVHVNDDVRGALREYARNSAPIRALLAQLNDSYKMAPMADVLAAVDAAVSASKNAKGKEALESYRKEVMSGDAAVSGYEEDESDVTRRHKKKNKFCSLFVKNCLNASNATISCNQTVGGTLTAGNVINNGNSTVSGCETVKGDIVFGPCGLHAKGSIEQNLLNLRGTLSLGSAGSTATATITRGCGFTATDFTPFPVSTNTPFTSGTAGEDNFAILAFGFTAQICFCSPFQCLPSVLATLEAAPIANLMITSSILPCFSLSKPAVIPALLTFVSVADVCNVGNSTCPNGGFTLRVTFIPVGTPTLFGINVPDTFGKNCNSAAQLPNIINALLVAISQFCTPVAPCTTTPCFNINFIAEGPCGKPVTPSCSPPGGCCAPAVCPTCL